MANREISLLFLPVALMAALLYGGRPGSPEAAREEGARRSEAAPPDKEHDFDSEPGPSTTALRLLRDFLEYDDEELATLARERGYCRQLEPPWDIDHLIAPSLDSLVVTIPDPLDSRYDFLFDRYLDAIQRAMEDSGYLLDRFSLPWFSEEPETSSQLNRILSLESTSTGQARIVLSESHHEMERAYRREPGVLLFRSMGRGRKLRLVFLVGETPTAGVHKKALLSALKTVALFLEEIPDRKKGSQTAFDGAAGRGQPRYGGAFPDVFSEPGVEFETEAARLAFALSRVTKTLDAERESEDLRGVADLVHLFSHRDSRVNLLGPTFSGSAVSLRMTLRSWLETREGNPRIRMISGSATAINGNAFSSLPNVTISTTVLPDEVLRSAIERFLKSPPRNATCDQIAYLTEANTAWGRSVSATRWSRDPKDDPADKCEEPPIPPQPSTNDPSLCGSSAINFYFPLHISDLRSAASKSEAWQADPLSQLMRGHRIPLTLDSIHGVHEIPPLASDLESSATEEVVSSLLRAVSRDGIRYVGIFASDVRDRLFLIRELREHCPNTLIFTTSADITYFHPSTNRLCRGLLVVSPYTINPLNQRWSYHDEKTTTKNQFPDETALGVYNAVLALHDAPCKMLEYGEPFSSDSGPTKPRLWISAVGQDGFYPLQEQEAPQKSVSELLSATNAPGKTDAALGSDRDTLVLAPSAFSSQPTIDLYDPTRETLKGFNAECLKAAQSTKQERATGQDFSAASHPQPSEDPSSATKTSPVPSERKPVDVLRGTATAGTLVLACAVLAFCLVPALHLHAALSPAALRERIPLRPGPWLLSYTEETSIEPRRGSKRGHLLAVSLVLAMVSLLGFTTVGLPRGVGHLDPLRLRPVDWVLVAGLLAVALLIVPTTILPAVSGWFERFRKHKWLSFMGPVAAIAVVTPLILLLLSSRTDRLVLLARLFTVATVVTVTSTLWTLGWLWKHRKNGLLSMPRVVTAVTVAVPFLLVLWLTFEWFRLPSNEAFFLYLRMANPRSGLSPLSPLLLIGAGALVFLSFSLRRLRGLERREVSGRILAFGGSLSELGDDEHEIRQLVARPAVALRGAWLVVLGLGLAMLPIFYAAGGISLEARPFDWLFTTSFTFLCGGFVLCVLRMALVWTRLRGVLRCLAAHPIERGFRGIVRDLGPEDRIFLRGRGQAVRSLERSVALAGSLVRESPVWASETLEGRQGLDKASPLLTVQRAVQHAEQTLHSARRAYAQGQWEGLIQQRSGAHDLLAQISRSASGALDRHWYSGSAGPRAGTYELGSPSPGLDTDPNGKEKGDPGYPQSPEERSAPPAVKPVGSTQSGLKAVEQPAGVIEAQQLEAKVIESRQLEAKVLESGEVEVKIVELRRSDINPFMHAHPDGKAEPQRLQEQPDESRPSDRQHPVAFQLDVWRFVGEKFLASRVIEFVQEITNHLEKLAICSVTGLLLLLLALGSYPFIRKDAYLSFAWIVIGATVLTVLTIMVQMNRNTILSILSRNDPQRVNLNRDFLIRVLGFGFVPLLLLLSAQFPASFQQMIPSLLRLIGGQH